MERKHFFKKRKREREKENTGVLVVLAILMVLKNDELVERDWLSSGLGVSSPAAGYQCRVVVLWIY